MAPLVPNIISNEFNLVIALLAGIGFGFVLEQAGFSSTKKLVGLFYGYDFTVLKVFFTAGVTAMIGVLLFAHWGVLDLSMIYINPTFLWSALVGGAVMGAGFIIGGFCPGTSVCAAAIGKLDGIAFVAGSALGILAFAEGYPVFKNIYLAEDWGGVLVNEQLGMSKIVFATILTAVAFSAFYVTHLIENRVNKYKSEIPHSRMIKYGAAGTLAFVILGLIAFSPSKEEVISKRISNFEGKKFNEVTADELAFEIANNNYKINVIDVRSPEEFKQYHLPLAINIPFEEITSQEWQMLFRQKLKTNYIYADNDSLRKKSFLLANAIGKSKNFVLESSSKQFQQLFSEHTLPSDNSVKEIKIYQYRQKLLVQMDQLVEALGKLNQPVKKKIVKIKGGCS